MAGRWSEKKDVAQISCFFSSKAEVTEDTSSFEYSLKNVLQEPLLQRPQRIQVQTLGGCL